MCNGTDSDGLTISSNGVGIVVNAGATVQERPDQAGAIVLQGPAGILTAALDNSGTVSSATGIALTSVTNPGLQAYQSIINRSAATISGANGAINVIVGRLDNSGTIDGGAGSAYAVPNVTQVVIVPSAIFNSGSILSNGSAPTIYFPLSSPQQFGNSGQIINSGSGPAIEAGIGLNLVNETTGVIGSAGPVAIRSPQISLINAGTINGSVIGGASFDYVDTRSGTINGDLNLGGGDDRLIASVGASSLIGNVTGTVDAGAGTDFLELIVGQDHSFSTSPLANGFERLQLDLQNDATLTLSGTVPDGGYSIRGNGTVRIGADMNAVGPLIIPQIAQQNLGFEHLNFVNDKALQSTLNDPLQTAVALENLDSVDNSGSILATGGNAASFRLNTDGLLSNSGTIEATGTALTVSGSIDNSGTIRSTGGIALANDLGGGVIMGRTSTNSGLIAGYTAGASISGLTFVNSGTVTASNGAGIVAASALIDNRAGGTISGTSVGVMSYDRSIVRNAGTIDGGVAFQSSAFQSGNVFIDQGGTVNGDVRFGDANDLYVTDLTRGLAGVSGLVDGGGGRDTLRLRVGADTTTIIAAAPAGFETIGYELENGATLHLSSPGLTATPLELGGTGTVDLNVGLSTATGPALNLAPRTTAQEIDPTLAPNTSLSVISRGTITFDGSAPVFPAAITAIPRQPGNRITTFENAGTINSTGPANQSFAPYTIWGVTEVTNSGTINLSSVIGVASARKLINSGTIVEAAGNRVSTAVIDVSSIQNSGTIQVNGGAIYFDTVSQSAAIAPALDNSGLIESRNGAALRGAIYNPVASEVHNGTTGVIRGKDFAIVIDGSLSLVNEGQIFGSVKLSTDFGSGNSSVTNLGSISGDVVFGAGDDRFVQTGGAVSGIVDGGDGTDSYVLDTSGGVIVEGGKIRNFENLTQIGTGEVVYSGDFTVGSLSLSGGTLRVAAGATLTAAAIAGSSASETIINAGTIQGSAILGGGDDSFIEEAGSRLTGIVDGGSGIDTYRVLLGGDRNGIDACSGFERLEVEGQGSLTGTLTQNFDLISLAGVNLNLVVGGFSVGQVVGSNAAEQLSVSGAIASIGLGGGDDLLRLTGPFFGSADGGAGSDTLELAGGSAGSPLSPNGTVGFEKLRVSSGFATISGDVSYDTVDVVAGRLTGLAGSRLVTPQVTVGNGGTYGSAGMVVGNIVVGSGGTLSPGASPGTMTVQGNVSLASGSVTAFEFTPTVSDKLLISGSLAIAVNATLDITGDRPLTPGVTYDLIVADGGITGSFTTTNKVQAVPGFLRQTGTRLQLLGTFLAPAGATRQATTAIDYVNDVLVSGGASRALVNSFPSLLDGSGTANASAFTLLTPEAYATAQQLGIEQGLSIAKVGRSAAMASPLAEAGAYTFAQGLGNWRKLRGNPGVGTSSAENHSYGALGGIGFGHQAGSIGAFVGYIDSNQRIRSLGASTDADGTIAGLVGHVAAQGFDLTILAAYDWSKAHTTRNVPGGTAHSGRYALESLVLDVSAGYSFPLSSDWALRPEAGISHVRTKRGGLTETGSTAFALQVDADTASSTFIDGSLVLRGGQQEGARFHPWVEAGLRHQLGGEVLAAWGGFIGQHSRFVAASATRNETLAAVGAGFSADLLPDLSFFAAYYGEFGSGAHSNSANTGIRYMF